MKNEEMNQPIPPNKQSPSPDIQLNKKDRNVHPK